MNDDKLRSPGHATTRTILRRGGLATVAVALVLIAIGIGSFFSSFGSFEPPRYFWCAFVGMPLLAVGVGISKFAYLGAIVRYVSTEVAPVGKDVTNYMVVGTKDSISDVDIVIGEGIE